MNSRKVAFGIIGLSVRIIVMALIIIYVYRTSITAYDFGFRVFAEPAVSIGEGKDVDVTIPLGKSVMEIGEILEEKGLIRDAKLFYFQEILSAYRRKMQPGSYTLNTSMTANEMMATMSASAEEEEEEDQQQ